MKKEKYSNHDQKLEEYSYKGGKEILKKKNLLDECRKLTKIWEDSEQMKELGWDDEHKFRIDKKKLSRPKRFDYYKDGVALEHEQKQQMDARWHLMKMDIGYQKNELDVGVFLFPKIPRNDANLDRMKKELESKLYQKYFPIEVPIFVIQYK